MSSRLDAGVELLERSLGYTRTALARVGPTDLTRRTPCERWDLAALLAHMDDALDAFLEAAGGSVSVRPSGPGDATGLCTKACTLLGVWSATSPSTVEVGGVALDTGLLVGTAALEITVHGWDVARALGLDHPIPGAFAAALLPWAQLVSAQGGFAPPVPLAGDAQPDARLLAALGRRP